MEREIGGVGSGSSDAGREPPWVHIGFREKNTTMVSAVGASNVPCSTPRDGQAPALAVRVAQTTRQTTTALTITTADGDTVSFSAAALTAWASIGRGTSDFSRAAP